MQDDIMDISAWFIPYAKSHLNSNMDYWCYDVRDGTISMGQHKIPTQLPGAWESILLALWKQESDDNDGTLMRCFMGLQWDRDNPTVWTMYITIVISKPTGHTGHTYKTLHCDC